MTDGRLRGDGPGPLESGRAPPLGSRHARLGHLGDPRRGARGRRGHGLAQLHPGPDRDRGRSSPAVVAAVGGPIEVQIAAFIVASIASLAMIRPIARRHLRTPAAHPHRHGGAGSAQRALVLERVDADSGQVKIGGEVWTRAPYDEDEVYEPGARVEVIKIEGATALVEE